MGKGAQKEQAKGKVMRVVVELPGVLLAGSLDTQQLESIQRFGLAASRTLDSRHNPNQPPPRASLLAKGQAAAYNGTQR